MANSLNQISDTIEKINRPIIELHRAINRPAQIMAELSASLAVFDLKPYILQTIPTAADLLPHIIDWSDITGVDAVYRSIKSLLVEVDNSDLKPEQKQAITITLTDLEKVDLAPILKTAPEKMSVARAREILGSSALTLTDLEVQDNIAFGEALADAIIQTINLKARNVS